MTIRYLLEKDKQRIFDLMYKTWLDTYVSDEFRVTKQDIDSFFATQKVSDIEIVSNRKVLRLIAETNTDCIGVTEAFIPKNKENMVYIRTLYVHPDFQRQGIGKKLLEEIKKHFSGLDLFLETAAYNKKGIDFYIKQGFTIDTTWTGNFLLPTGNAIPLVRLVNL